MTRNPDDDADAKRLELSLRESNLEVHKTNLDRAEELLQRAQLAVHDFPAEDEIDPLAVASTYSALANALSTYTTARFGMEVEQSAVEHMRAHVDHEDQLEAKREQASSIVTNGMESVREALRAAGIEVVDTSQMGGFPGIVIRRTNEDDSPNT